MEKLELKSGRALVVVAHPDDETIWMGGTILKNPQVRWTIFSLCRASDQDRAPKFRNACSIYGATSIITDLEDEGIVNAAKSVSIIRKLVKNEVGQEYFDYIFTHGSNGEYGHPRHIGVNRAVGIILKNEEIGCGRLFNFAYNAGSKKKIVSDKKANFFIQLNKNEHLIKRKIIQEIYGFKKNSFENRSALVLETFK